MSNLSQITKGSCGTGLIANIHNQPSHKILKQGLNILKNLEHRGATGQDPLSGDGSGILVEIPDKFFREALATQNVTLPPFGVYGVGMFFFSRNQEIRQDQQEEIVFVVKQCKLKFLSWRKVPSNNESLSPNDLSIEPSIYQLFVTSNDKQQLAQELYLLRKKICKLDSVKNDDIFNIPSFSNKTIVYKGLFLAQQLINYYLDFANPTFETSFVLVHQRYSTNTMPSWKLAHPMRLIGHNGEINTIIGNINSVNAREGQFTSDLFVDSSEHLYPIIETDCSDSLGYDNFLEFLVQNKIDLPEAIMMMMPQAWENDSQQSDTRAFYEYHAPLVEAWDGPAAIVFADGDFIGAALDRNGLRPLRYYQTEGGTLIIGSEAGLLPLEDKIIKKGKLGPGEIIAVDRKNHTFLNNNKIKKLYSTAFPYQKWNQKNKIFLNNNHQKSDYEPEDATLSLLQRQKIFGYSEEELQLLLKNMSETGEELIYAMGIDTPLSILSENPKLLYSYFKQRFAQVTNPPIDPIREECNMSLQSYIGGKLNLLNKDEKNAHTLVLDNPLLQRADFVVLQNQADFKCHLLDITYNFKEQNLNSALAKLNQEAVEAVLNGNLILVLTDKNVTQDRAPIPALLAVSAIHHHLIEWKQRGKVGIVVATAEARETHHFALLLGYGASAIYPYLVYETIAEMYQQKQIGKISLQAALQNYITAVLKGIKKIMSKMGISTLNSYQGAQIFEALGLSQNLIDKYFYGTASSIGGMELNLLEKELLLRNKQAWLIGQNQLATGGEYNWREQGETHAYNPETIHLLQQAAWKNDYTIYQKFSASINDSKLYKLRNLVDFNFSTKIDLAEIESETEIVKRFCTGAMSLGAISKESHEDLAIAMNQLGAKSNTGEGGEDKARYQLDKDGNSRKSKIKQIASGRFGVTSYYLNNAEEIQIKIAQGAKPGEGGQIKGIKVDDYIANLRYTVKGVQLISPPPHHDIYSIEDLAQLIYDLKNANPQAKVSVKLVASQGVGTVAVGVVKGKADKVLISGFEGGTGASPASSIKHAGIPWEIGLAETQQMLVLNNIRDRVILQVDGQITTGREVIIGALLGAEEFGFSTAALVTQGCILMRKCHLNTCPVGIATQNPLLRAKYKGKVEYVVNYFLMVAREIREIMAQLGIRKFEDLIGNTQLLKIRENKHNLKSKNIDFSLILNKVRKKDAVYRNITNQENQLKTILDNKLIQLSKSALTEGKAVRFGLNINNTQRAVGTMLGSKITKKYGEQGLPEDTICIDCKGTGGQSFGAFLPSGVSIRVVGDANDYLAKGLCGGKIIVTSKMEKPEENTIVGNTVLYGATSGKVFLNGIAGERFAVRNSGASTVVEGVGEHGCEYMTGGVVVILGVVGRNFGAGMSGGLVYVYGQIEKIQQNCNAGSIELVKIYQDSQVLNLWELIAEHAKETASPLAKKILADKDTAIKNFCLAIPKSQVITSSQKKAS